MTRSGVVPSGLALAILLGLGACSGSDGDRGADAGNSSGADRSGSPSATPDTAAIRTGLIALVAGEPASTRAKKDASCFADALIQRTTVEELRDAGILDASYDVVAALPVLPRPDAATWVDAQFSCTDFVAESARAQAQLSHGAIDPSTYAQCLRLAMTDTQLRAAVIEPLSGTWDGPALARFSTAQADCRKQATPIL